MKNLTTPHRHYPQPHLSNRLQDDVGRLATAFEMVDQDMTAVQQDITTLQQDLIDNRWQRLDLTDAALQADSFYPVLLGLTPAMGSQVLEFRCLQASASDTNDANAVQSTNPTPDNCIQWQAAFACLGDVWAGEHNLNLIRYAHAQGLDLLADYQWDPKVPVAVVWLRGQQVYQVRSSHQRLALLPLATTQSTLAAMEPNQVQVHAQGVVCSHGDTSNSYAPLAAINTDQVQVGQVDVLTFLEMQATLTTHATELAQLAAAKAQLTATQAEQHTALTNQLQQHNATLTAQLDEQTRLLGRLTYDKSPQVGDIIPHAYHYEYLSCNGQTYPQARYPALAKHLGEASYLDDQGVASFRMPVQYDAKALKMSIQQAPTKQWSLADSDLWGIAVNGERVFVSLRSKGEIWGYDHAGNRKTVWQGLKSPYGLWASNDRLYVADYAHHQVQVRAVNQDKVLETIAASLAIDVQVQGDTLWIALKNDNKVVAHSLTTGQSREIDTQHSNLRALAVSGDRLYVTYGGDQITIHDTKTGALIEAWQPGLSGAYGLAVQGSVLAVADRSNHRVRLFNRLTKAHLGDIEVADFQYPTACRFDAKGLWVTWQSHGVTYHDLTACYASMRALPLGG
jgi:hypothetical protein